jgi:hypothetical protein
MAFEFYYWYRSAELHVIYYAILEYEYRNSWLLLLRIFKPKWFKFAEPDWMSFLPMNYPFSYPAHLEHDFVYLLIAHHL